MVNYKYLVIEQGKAIDDWVLRFNSAVDRIMPGISANAVHRDRRETNSR
jgi:hypothetical protein